MPTSVRDGNKFRGDNMEDGIVTFMGSLAFGAMIFAIVLGLGKKYHNEDQKKMMSKQIDTLECSYIFLC